MAVLPDGGFVVTFTGLNSASVGQYVSRFSANGAPQGSAQQVNTEPLANGSTAAVTALAEGGFVVAWVSATNSDENVHAQLFSSSGGADRRLVHREPIHREQTGIARRDRLAGRRILIVWETYHNGPTELSAALSMAPASRWAASSRSTSMGLYAHQRCAGGAGQWRRLRRVGRIERCGNRSLVRDPRPRLDGGFFATEQVAIDLKGSISVTDADAGAASLPPRSQSGTESSM